ncbi:acetyltransferase [Tomitella fengzijianii]|uniref:acetyltransferase n=1 Tax=Tomitella fengzijianii TaxID=2597660 RepID=UPI0039A09819
MERASERGGPESEPRHDAPDISIRSALGPEEYPRLVRVWRSAVDATHDFLAEEHRAEIESHLASDYFPQVALFVAERGGVPVGFAGVAEGNLEMLFVDASARHQGVGSALLSFVTAGQGVRTVDVNEQNAQAVGFYRSRGFRVIDRSELDDQGRPYPLVHMAVHVDAATVDSSAPRTGV